MKGFHEEWPVGQEMPLDEHKMACEGLEGEERLRRRYLFTSHPAYHDTDFPEAEETCATDIDDLVYSDEDYDYMGED